MVDYDEILTAFRTYAFRTYAFRTYAFRTYAFRTYAFRTYAFRTYYDPAELSNVTDHRLVFDLRMKLDAAGFLRRV